MKYLGVLGAIVLLVGAILFGFYLGQKSDEKNASTDTTSQSAQMQERSSSNAVVLDLSDTGLTKVSSDIYDKTSTTDLILSNNSIKTLPSEMGKMTNVVVFKIDHNVLDGSLIAEVRQMSKLKHLDVSYNNMTGMPAEIGQLSNLETLNYSYNDITGLPNELANLKNNLKEFNLTGNPLSSETIEALKADLPNTNIIF
jgi:Leucine-rich repeat (LRR) protein